MQLNAFNRGLGLPKRWLGSRVTTYKGAWTLLPNGRQRYKTCSKQDGAFVARLFMAYRTARTLQTCTSHLRQRWSRTKNDRKLIGTGRMSDWYWRSRGKSKRRCCGSAWRSACKSACGNANTQTQTCRSVAVRNVNSGAGPCRICSCIRLGVLSAYGQTESKTWKARNIPRWNSECRQSKTYSWQARKAKNWGLNHT